MIIIRDEEDGIIVTTDLEVMYEEYGRSIRRLKKRVDFEDFAEAIYEKREKRQQIKEMLKVPFDVLIVVENSNPAIHF